ncbi:MAG: polysaccharide pyruvyl transferase family protein [Planctomycetia bacterium]
MRLLERLLGSSPAGRRPSSAARSRQPSRQVGIVGTFDVENYGDLLFPLIARAMLERRLGPVDMVAFSPNARSAPTWPYDVRTVLDLPEALPSLSALLVGGGQIIRFDHGYPIPVDPRVHTPIDYWLTPALLAALAGKPVIWNAIGAWTGSPPAPWYDDTLRAVLSASHLVGLRDEASREHLAAIAPQARLRFVPDTAFSLARLWPLAEESAGFLAWRRALGVRGPYVVVQADTRIGPSRPAIDALVAGLGVETGVLLPVCRCHGDSSDGLPPLPCRHTARSDWPAPLLLGEIIGRATAVVASSLHACITAIAYGVPVVRVPSFNVADRKFALLDGFAGVAGIGRADAVAAVLARGRRRGRGPEPRAVEHADRLERYWDEVAAGVLAPQRPASGGCGATLLRWAADMLPTLETAGQKGGGSGP